MSEITTVELDLAKNVFQFHGADGSGRAVTSSEPFQPAKTVSKTVSTPKKETVRITQCIEKYGGPGAIRTPDPQIRSLMLYPAELRVRRRRM
jgi:hypothetical protein